jgi:hypothetical protein
MGALISSGSWLCGMYCQSVPLYSKIAQGGLDLPHLLFVISEATHGICHEVGTSFAKQASNLPTRMSSS